MINKLSQIPLSPPGGFTGPAGGLFSETGSTANLAFSDVLSLIIGVMTVVAAIWFVFNTLVGAIGIISASGDKNAYEQARQRITTGILGLIVVISAVFLVDVIGQLLGFNAILDPAGFIQTTN